MRMLTPVATWKSVRELAPVELGAGHLDLNPTSLHELYMIAWMATNADAHPSVRLSPPPDVDWSEVEASVTEMGQDLIVGHDESGARWQALKDIRDLGSLLGELPEGTELELFTATEDSCGNHRYVGTVKEGTWRLSHTYPATDRGTLCRALELATADPIELDTAELAERAEALADAKFGGTFMQVVREGNQLSGQMKDEPCDSVTDMVRPFAFAVAFADGPWDISVVSEQDDEEEFAQLNQQLANMFTQPDPVGKKLVWGGKFGRFFPAELTDQAHVIEEDQSILDQEMMAIGFKALGGLSCNKIPGTTMRGYVSTDGDYGLGTASQDGMFLLDFYTVFEDGSSLTTTTNPYADNMKRKKIFRRSLSHLEPAELLAEHRKGVQKRKEQVVGGEASLKGLAQAIDEYLDRQGGFLY